MASFLYCWEDFGKTRNSDGFSFCHAALPQHDKNTCLPPSNVVFRLKHQAGKGSSVCVLENGLEYPLPPPVPTFVGDNHIPMLQTSEAWRCTGDPNHTISARALSRVKKTHQKCKWCNRGPNITDSASELCQAPPLVKDVPLPAVISSTQSSLSVR